MLLESSFEMGEEMKCQETLPIVELSKLKADI
jgi:hypothetical protein